MPPPKAIYPTDTPLKRLSRDLYHGETLDPKRTVTILMMVLQDLPSTKEVEGWTEEQRHHACNWAMREYWRASDNRNLRLVKPDFLEPYK